MKRRFLALGALLLLPSACRDEAGSFASATGASSTEDAESGQARALEAGRALIGKVPPAAVLKTIDGEAIDLKTNYGRRPIYLKFWATWCIPCREQMPGFEADFRKYGDKILTLAVNTGFNDSEEAIREYRQRHGLTMPIAIDDGSLGAALNLRVTPQHVVIGRSGKILFVGHEEDAALRKALDDALAEPPGPATARHAIRSASYGVGDLVGDLGPALSAAAGFPVTGVAKDGKPRVLLFFSPWCESYLKESRPRQAAACARIREQGNQLAKAGGHRLVGISSGLWSSAKDLADYRASQDSRIPLHLDDDGRLFRSFGVQDVPTVIVIDSNGRVARRIGPADKDLNVSVIAARAE